MEEGAQGQETQNKKMERRLLGKIFCLVQRVYNLQRLESKQEELEEGEEMKQQQRMRIMKDLTKKIRSKGRMDAENRCWVTELLAADREKAWIHPGWRTQCKSGMSVWKKGKKR